MTPTVPPSSWNRDETTVRRNTPRSGLRCSVGAGLVAVLAITACGASRTTSLASQQAPSAFIGDGVCAAELGAYGYSLRPPPQSSSPTHSKDEAINAARSDLIPEAAKGTADAYLAVVSNSTQASGSNSPSTLTWVVEVNGLDHPYGIGGALHPQTIHLHHLLDFIDATTLTPQGDVSCP
jgi:hypothetical protein